MEYLRKKERIIRRIINPNPRGDPNLLDHPKSFAGIVKSLHFLVGIAKEKIRKRNNFILIPSLRRKMVMCSLQFWPLMQVIIHG